MTLTLEPILLSAGIDPADTQVIRHAFVREHGDTGLRGIHADSTDDEILTYTSQQSVNPRTFPVMPPRVWVVFVREGGDRARLWAVVENRGELSNDGVLRTFDLVFTEHLADLRNRLQAVMREHRYASWRTALSSVVGVYLITDTRDGRQYVGKADGAESIRQRWSAYATNGHGGNVELRGCDPTSFRYSLLRVFDPSTPAPVIDVAESHFKHAMDTRKHGLNRN